MNRVSYEGQTQENILQRMLEQTKGVDTREGSITWDMLSPASIELAYIYLEMENILAFGFADSTYGEYLDRRVNEVGLTRKPATYAEGTVIFTGTPGKAVPIGTVVSAGDENPLFFKTVEDAEIGVDGTAVVLVEAQQAGASSNVAMGMINTIVSYVSGVVSVTNEGHFDGGADEESDAELLERYLVRMRTPATSGNVHQYYQWAMSIPGIGGAKVYPLWNGNGTVKVKVIDSEMSPPAEKVVQEVKDYIEEVRPIGADVTVEGANPVDIMISASLVLEPNSTLEQATNDIRSTVQDYLKSLAYKDSVVRYNQIASYILDSPYVLDFDELLINGKAKNVIIPDGDVAVLGEVTVDEQPQS